MDYFAGETYRPEDVKVGWTSMRLDLIGRDMYELPDNRVTNEINTRCCDLDWRDFSTLNSNEQ